MAGSYKHAVTPKGHLRSNRSFANMIDNIGDAYEMAEEMYGMIWFLAAQTPDPVAAVEEARQGYERGLAEARRILSGDRGSA
jgi:hypothetical protein